MYAHSHPYKYALNCMYIHICIHILYDYTYIYSYRHALTYTYTCPLIRLNMSTLRQMSSECHIYEFWQANTNWMFSHSFKGQHLNVNRLLYWKIRNNHFYLYFPFRLFVVTFTLVVLCLLKVLRLWQTLKNKLFLFSHSIQGKYWLANFQSGLPSWKVEEITYKFHLYFHFFAVAFRLVFFCACKISSCSNG